MRAAFWEHIVRHLKSADYRWLATAGSRYLFMKYLRKLPVLKEGFTFQGPITAALLLTYRCISQCTMCSLADRRLTVGGNSAANREMNTKAVYDLLTELRDMGVMAVSLSGGEPLMRKDLFDIIAHSRFLGFTTSVSTNGIMINADVASRLVDSGLDQITVSLDCADAEDYAVFRGSGGITNAYSRVVESISLLAKANSQNGGNLSTVVSSIIRPEKPDLARTIIQTAKNAGADGIFFAPVHNFEEGKVSCKTTIPVHTKDFGEYLYGLGQQMGITIDSSKQYLSLFSQAFDGVPFPLECLAAYSMLLIDPYGALFPCGPHSMLDKKMGTYVLGELKRTWHSPALREVRRSLRNCRDCYWNCHAEYSMLFA